MALGKYQRDFKKADYSNPVIKKDKERKFRKLRVFAFIVIGILLLATIIFLFFTPFFKIVDVSFTGLQRINPEAMQSDVQNYLNQRVLLIFQRRNYFIFDKQTLQTYLLDKYNLQSVQVNKRLPRFLALNFVEKKPVLELFSADKCYGVDDKGLVIGQCEAPNLNILLIDLNAGNYQLNEIALSQSEVAFIQAIYEKFKQPVFNQFGILNANKNFNSLEIKAMPEKSFFFNFNDNLDDQFARLKILLNQKEVQEKINEIKYFDLRFKEKVYYK